MCQVARYSLVLIVLLCCALVVGCAGGQSAQAPTASGSATTSSAADAGSEPAAAETPDGPAKVGEEQKSGPWSFTVTEVYTKEEAPGQVPAADGQGAHVRRCQHLQLRDDDSRGQARGLLDEGLMGQPSRPSREAGVQRSRHEPARAQLQHDDRFIYAVDPGSTGYVFTFAPQVDGTATPMEVAVR